MPAVHGSCAMIASLRFGADAAAHHVGDRFILGRPVGHARLRAQQEFVVAVHGDQQRTDFRVDRPILPGAARLEHVAIERWAPAHKWKTCGRRDSAARCPARPGSRCRACGAPSCGRRRSRPDIARASARARRLARGSALSVTPAASSVKSVDLPAEAHRNVRPARARARTGTARRASGWRGGSAPAPGRLPARPRPVARLRRADGMRRRASS